MASKKETKPRKKYKPRSEPKARWGRPPVKPPVTDPEAVQVLCDLMVSGLSIRKACEDPRCPNQTDVYVQQARDEIFRAKITKAREAQQAAIIDGILDMADAATSEDHQVVRLRIWARQW